MVASPATGNLPPLILGAGLLLIAAQIIRGVMNRLALPPLAGHFALGLALAWADARWSWVGAEGGAVLAFLGAVGAVVLLFRVGIESNLHQLLTELPKATAIWIFDFAATGAAAYLFMRHALDFALAPSLFVAVAMTATSVGVSVAVWQETGAIRSPQGKLLLDTAELDDLSAVAAMALLFSLAPIVKEASAGGGLDGAAWGRAASEGVRFAGKLLAFVAAILFAGRYLEAPLAHCARRLGEKSTTLLFAVGLGMVVAGISGSIGLSLPVGALFAGLLLSRHREAYGFAPLYASLHALFVPFFFIAVGFRVQPGALGGALGLGLALFLLAVAVKALATGLPASRVAGPAGGALIGLSMAPRAEIAMVVMERGRQLGAWAVPQNVYAAMIFVSAATCLATAATLHWALRRWPPQASAGTDA